MSESTEAALRHLESLCDFKFPSSCCQHTTHHLYMCSWKRWEPRNQVSKHFQNSTKKILARTNKSSLVWKFWKNTFQIKMLSNIQGWTRSLKPKSGVQHTGSWYTEHDRPFLCLGTKSQKGWWKFLCKLLNVFSAPSPPGRVVAVSGGAGDLLVAWTQPKQPNGRLLQYTVSATEKK